MADIITLRESTILIMTHIHGMWRHRGNMLATTWLICIIGWISVYFLDNQYMATARISIEDPKGQVTPYLRAVSEMPMDVTDEARRVLNSLLSRNNLEQVLRNTDLVQPDTSSKEREKLLSVLSTQVSIVPIARNSNVYRISHTHSNALVAKQVVQGLVDLLDTGTQRNSGANPSSMAKEFLVEQIKESEKRVAESEEMLQQFKKKNAELLPDDSGGYYKKLKSMNSDLDKERVKNRELVQRRAELQRQYTSLTGQPAQDDETDNTNQTYDAKIQEMKASIAEMMGRFYVKGGVKRFLYTEEHPEIIAIKRQISQLEQQKSANRNRGKDMRSEMDRIDQDNDPVLRQVKIGLSTVEADIAASNARIDEQTRQLVGLRNLENTLPGVEAELIRLERNLSINREKMLSLLDMQGKVTMNSDMVDGLSKHVRFRILEQPQQPMIPIGPNRPLFLSVVLVGGLLAGIVMAMFLSVIRPVFDSPSAIKKELGLPVLGTVSLINEASRGLFRIPAPLFFFMLAALFFAYLGFLIPQL